MDIDAQLSEWVLSAPNRLFAERRRQFVDSILNGADVREDVGKVTDVLFTVFETLGISIPTSIDGISTSQMPRAVRVICSLQDWSYQYMLDVKKQMKEAAARVEVEDDLDDDEMDDGSKRIAEMAIVGIKRNEILSRAEDKLRKEADNFRDLANRLQVLINKFSSIDSYYQNFMTALYETESGGGAMPGTAAGAKDNKKSSAAIVNDALESAARLQRTVHTSFTNMTPTMCELQQNLSVMLGLTDDGVIHLCDIISKSVVGDRVG